MDPRSTEIPGSRVKMMLGPGTLANLGPLARSLGAKNILLVTDPGVMAAGHPQQAIASLQEANLTVAVFDDVAQNPTTHHVKAGANFAQSRNIDFLVGLGGGSAMDCAKGINFLLTNGGKMQDYRGVAQIENPLLPMIAVPTTAGTGSDAQSYALITDANTHQKMACGNPGALPAVAILDPNLTATQPKKVAAIVGIDALSHAIESSACKKRNDISRKLSKDAWNLLEPSFEKAIGDSPDEKIRGQMLMGAHLAGAAIENSMLGAAHSLANALTATNGLTHGLAVGVMLPHVIRFNSANGENPYSDLDPSADHLANRVDHFLQAAGLPRRLRDCKFFDHQIDSMAAIAAKQWTAAFNPRPISEPDFREILHKAF